MFLSNDASALSLPSNDFMSIRSDKTRNPGLIAQHIEVYAPQSNTTYRPDRMAEQRDDAPMNVSYVSISGASAITAAVSGAVAIMLDDALHVDAPTLRNILYSELLKMRGFRLATVA
jgi:hypothetical protein